MRDSIEKDEVNQVDGVSMHPKLRTLLLTSLFLVSLSLCTNAATAPSLAFGKAPMAVPMTGVVIDSPVNGSHLSALNITVSWHVIGPVAVIQYYLVSVDWGSWINNSLRTSITLIMPQDGAHSVRVQAWTEVEAVYSDTVIFVMDTIPPSVIGHLPTGTEVPASSVMVISFSEDMNQGSVQVTGIQGNSNWDDRTLTLTPYEPLLLEQNYIITVYGQDLAGNNLTWFAWSFSTSDLGSVKGQVRDDQYSTVSGADVLLIADGEVVAETTTDADGRFQLSAPAGAYDLSISKSDIIAKTVPVEISVGEEVDLGVVEVQLAPDYAWLLINAVIVIGAVGLFFVGNRNQRLRRK